jgi:hypothetical protein
MAYLLVSFYCTFIALGAFLFGYDIGVISSSIQVHDFQETFRDSLSDAVTGGIVSSYTGKGTIIRHILDSSFCRSPDIITTPMNVAFQST